jgi:CRISPR-associated endonuclease/helicase Cas3
LKLKVKAIQFRTVVLPVEAGGLSPEGLLKGSEENASDVAEAGGTRKRLLLESLAGEYRARPIVGDGSDMEMLNTILSGAAPASPEEAAEAIAQHYKWQVSQLIPLHGDSEEEEDAKQFLALLVEPKRATAENPETAARKKQPTVEEHCQLAGQWAARFASLLDLNPPQGQALAIAANWHDRGKDRSVWQRAIYNNGPVAYAKSGPRGMDGRRLGGYRHELGSLLEAMHDPEIANHPEADLILHLIAVHHGWARPHFLPSAWDSEFTTADNNQAVVEAMRRFGRLQQRFGRWGLAWLEALMHAVDVLASNQLPPPENELNG